MKTSRSALCTTGFMAMLALAPAPSPADTTISSTDKYAYGANIGWVNFAGDTTQGVVIGETHVSGYAYSANCGWINFGGFPANGHTFANTSAADFGVNRDGTGNLAGFAYGANIGWINFGWAAAADANRPRFNLLNGQFAGYAYSANCGWIKLGSGYLTVATVYCADADYDGIGDAWEYAHFDNLFPATSHLRGDPDTDADYDGVIDLDEYRADSDPNDAASYFKIVSQTHNAGYTEVTIVFTSSPARVYKIQQSTELLPETWTDEASLGTFIADAGATTTRTFSHPTGLRRFFRAVATKPLSAP